MGVVICANAIFIGVSMDWDDNSAPWKLADAFFSGVFLLEVGLKLRIRGGFCGMFCGADALANTLDVVLVLVDFIQLAVSLLFPDMNAFLDKTPQASLFRLARLVKLSRMVRLLSSEYFKDLAIMLQGIYGGMSTLLWSMLLFIVVVYVMALVFREALGRSDEGLTELGRDNVFSYFQTVPRSMYTTFRCSIGDCNSAAGMPIFEHVQREFGTGMSLIYSLFIFVVTLGLFNVISAMFVERTMEAASALQRQKKRERLLDEHLLYTRVAAIMRRILELSPEHTPPERMSEHLDELLSAEVPCAIIEAMVRDPIAKAALDDLDILPSDRARLADIFDPDNGGTVTLIDIATGLRRLRGDPRRSDIICVDLMIRSIQENVEQILESVKAAKADYMCTE